MSYTLPHASLTPILGENATYDPRTETTSAFMNGKFTELLENDQGLAQQINVLKPKALNVTYVNGWAPSSSSGTWEENRAWLVGNVVFFTFRLINAAPQNEWANAISIEGVTFQTNSVINDIFYSSKNTNYVAVQSASIANHEYVLKGFAEVKQ